MQTPPSNWAQITSGQHWYKYYVLIDGGLYGQEYITGTPRISRPAFDSPCIGRCCTGSLAITLLVPSDDIPKAASVTLYIAATNGTITTDMVPLGTYFVTSREGDNPTQLTCLDPMIKAGQTYLDKTSFTEWPQSMSAVYREICRIMGVTMDSELYLNPPSTGYVSYPNEDMLMSEVLSYIAAAYGGNWIISPIGELTLATLWQTRSILNLRQAYKKYTNIGKTSIISGVTLIDSAGNEFTSGDDSGRMVVASCDYATNAIAASVANLLVGEDYYPYKIETAYLDPLAELCDEVFFTEPGITYRRKICAMDILCTPAFTCTLMAGTDEETEQEFPYYTLQELKIERSVRTDQTYFGNSITRENGFISELMINDEPKAQMIANATMFKMSIYNPDTQQWEAKIYYDSVSGKYVITADVTIIGALTIQGMKTELSSNSGETYIDGSHIITGTITADAVKVNTVWNYTGDKVAIYSSGSTDLYVGGVAGNDGWGFSNTYIFAKNQIVLGKYDEYGPKGVIVDLASYNIRPANAAVWTLGNASYPFGIVNSAQYSLFYIQGDNISATAYLSGANANFLRITSLKSEDIYITNLSGGIADLNSLIIATSDRYIRPNTNGNWQLGTTNYYLFGVYALYIYAYNITAANSISASSISVSNLSAGTISGTSLNINALNTTVASISYTGEIRGSRLDATNIGAVNVSVSGDLAVYGIKNRVVSTENYDTRLLYCLESPEPLFEDVGEAETDENGTAYIFFDPIFAETIYQYGYQVFVQPYSTGNFYVANRTDLYFVVIGPPSATFGWRVIAKQYDYTEKRLDVYVMEEHNESHNINHSA